MSFSDMFKGFKDFFTVDNPVSSTSFGMSSDVVKTQNALGELGYFNEYTPDIGEGLKSFQAEQGLKVDGLMNPGGETENALSQTLASQGIGNTGLLAKSDNPLSSNVTVTKPTSSKPDQKSWRASASFGELKKPKPTPKAKIDPMTGLVDPLAQAPKGKMPTAKQWEEVAKLQKKKTKTAIVPEGKTVQQRISSMMFDPRYQDKNDTGLRDHVVKQFEKAYPGTLQFDETGKMVQPQPVIKPEQVEPYDPNGELKIQEQSYDQGQTDYVQGISNELPQRDQTTSANASQRGRVDYPQAANVRSTSAKSSDQLASAIPLNADALKDAEGYGLEQAEQGNSYQVAQASQTDVMSDAEKSSQVPPYEENNPPTINEEKERLDAIANDKPAKFKIEKNPEASGDFKIHEVPILGRYMVKQHDTTIEKMAKKHGVDPDMIRAVMWSENARGHKLGGNLIGDLIGNSKTPLPMNMNKETGAKLIGKTPEDLYDPANNIEASAIMLKRISDRIDNPTAAKIGSIWNFTGREKTNDFGEYIQRVYDEKPWLKSLP